MQAPCLPATLWRCLRPDLRVATVKRRPTITTASSLHLCALTQVCSPPSSRFVSRTCDPAALRPLCHARAGHKLQQVTPPPACGGGCGCSRHVMRCPVMLVLGCTRRNAAQACAHTSGCIIVTQCSSYADRACMLGKTASDTRTDALLQAPAAAQNSAAAAQLQRRQATAVRILPLLLSFRSSYCSVCRTHQFSRLPCRVPS